MTYKLLISGKAEKQLRKLNRYQEQIIIRWLRKNVDGSIDPRAHGSGLTANLSEHWRYRIGDYRVICEIHDDVCEVLAVSVGHRSKIYEKRNK